MRLAKLGSLEEWRCNDPGKPAQVMDKGVSPMRTEINERIRCWIGKCQTLVM